MIEETAEVVVRTVQQAGFDPRCTGTRPVGSGRVPDVQDFIRRQAEPLERLVKDRRIRFPALGIGGGQDEFEIQATPI